MKNKQVGITKPLLVANDLLRAITDDQKLLNKIDYVRSLYSTLREKLKDGKIETLEDINKGQGKLPELIKNKLNNGNFIEQDEFETIHNRIIKLSKLILLKNENTNNGSQKNLEEVKQLEKELSCGGKIIVSIDQNQLSHAGTISVIPIMPFLDSLPKESLFFEYIRAIQETIAAMKVVNTRIMSALDLEQKVCQIVEFGKPSFLSLATIVEVKSTDNVSLFADLATAIFVLKNDPELKLSLTPQDTHNILLLVKSEADKIQNIKTGEEILKKIIQKQIQNSSDEDKAYYQEYLDVLNDNKKLFQNVPLLKKVVQVIKEVISTEVILRDKGINTKNLLQNLEETCARIEGMKESLEKSRVEALKETNQQRRMSR